MNLYGVTFLPERIGQEIAFLKPYFSKMPEFFSEDFSVEYIVINSLFDKGETVSEGICFTSQSKVTGLLEYVYGL